MGLAFHLHLEGKIRIRMSCFLLVLQRMNSVKYNFIMLKNEMESYVRIGGRGLKNLTCPYMGVGKVKNCKNHPCGINEWPLICTKGISS